jgi:hypothetical protein
MLLKNKEILQRMVHMLSGGMILIHAYEKYESGHASHAFFAIAGLLFITIALLHPIIEKKAPWVDGVFFFIEGVLSLFVAYDFFHMGKKGLPFAYIVAALFQFFSAYKLGKKGIQNHHQQSTDQIPHP